MLRVDLHSHTHVSRDAVVPPLVAVERSVAAGIDRLAITDHNEIDGALEAAARYPDRVIVGEEIDCACGTDLIGLFLTERIPRGLPMDEVAARIRAQGGIVYAPHPYAYVTKRRERVTRLLQVADLFEAINSRAFWPAWNRLATAHGQTARVPIAAGTDAHFPWEFGRAYTEMPAFRTAEEFRAVMSHAAPRLNQRASAFVHVGSVVVWGGKTVRDVLTRSKRSR